MQIVMAFLVGLVFGIGLIISGMTNPAKVQGFLDLAGQWDPSLAFVMGGAILISLIAFTIAARRKRSLLGGAMYLPVTKQIDLRLIVSGLAFGAGWGLSGFCPGPAIASLLVGGEKVLIFTAAMLVGMGIFEWLERRSAARKAATL